MQPTRFSFSLASFVYGELLQKKKRWTTPAACHSNLLNLNLSKCLSSLSFDKSSCSMLLFTFSSKLMFHVRSCLFFSSLKKEKKRYRLHLHATFGLRSTTWIVVCNLGNRKFHRDFVVSIFLTTGDGRSDGVCSEGGGWTHSTRGGHRRGCREECRKDGARYWADGKSELTELFRRTLKIQFSLAWLI